MTQTTTLLDLLEQSATTFRAIPDDKWNHKPNPLKWSKKEVLGHLVDSALTNLRRFIVTQYRPGEKIVYHQDEWVALQHYADADPEALIMLWVALNRQIVRVIERVPPEKLLLTCDTGKETPELHSLQFLIDDYLVHLQHHLSQIVEGPSPSA
jgi:hypothetical protein